MFARLMARGDSFANVRHFGSKTAKVLLGAVGSKSAKVGHPARQTAKVDILGYPIVIGVKTPRSLKYFDEIEATELSVSRLVANSRFQDG